MLHRDSAARLRFSALCSLLISRAMCAALLCLAVVSFELSSTSRINIYRPHQVRIRAGSSARMAMSRLSDMSSAVASARLGKRHGGRHRPLTAPHTSTTQRRGHQSQPHLVPATHAAVQTQPAPLLSAPPNSPTSPNTQPMIAFVGACAIIKLSPTCTLVHGQFTGYTIALTLLGTTSPLCCCNCASAANDA